MNKLEVTIEKMTECHKKDVINILNYYIENSTAAYREDAVDYSAFHNMTEDCIDDSKYVIKNGNDVIGFSLLEYFMPIRTFRETAEVTYFINKEYIGKGIGKKALEILEDDAREKGIKTLVANITSDNVDSIRFHERNGFVKYGELEIAGIKFNKHFGITYMKKCI